MINTNNALQKYRQVGASSVIYQDPLKIINMLYDTALERITNAKNSIKNNKPHEKCENIDHVIKIVESLQLHLDKEKGEDIATNLYALYDYINRRLLHANLNNDIQALDEATALLSELHQAWAHIMISNNGQN